MPPASSLFTLPSVMTTERWHRVQTLFQAVLEQPDGAQRAFLEEACAEDPALKTEVLALLDALDHADAFIDDLADRVGLPSLVELLPGLPAGEEEVAGRYRLLEEIGHGGMGVVYRAEDPQVGRTVALKRLRERCTSGVHRRFEHEQHVLGGLQHPHIARLYDGGVTEEGRPYFVMEYVDGRPIDQYCDTHRLPVRERLALFLAVVEAVQHAHQNLVVHRDLKPSNILVTEEGVVKLLDFGIAKILHGEGEGGPEAALTRTGERWMTPEYAAPEQVRGEAVTTATDVYQLGVVLYELLSGRKPYAFKEHSLYEISQVICDAEPSRPSTAVMKARGTSGAGTTPEAVGEARGTTARQLRRTLGGDLDAICLKALCKEPERRYASAEALAADLRRYLDGFPIEGRRGTELYRIVKFVRRNRESVVAAVGVLVLVLLFGFVHTTRIKQERDLAQREQARAENVASFLVELFEEADPSEASGEQVTVRALVDWGAQQAEALQGQPHEQAALMGAIARAYHGMGAYAESQQLMEASIAQLRRLQAAPDPALATALTDYAELLIDRGTYDQAKRLLEETLDLWDKLPGQELPLSRSLNALGLAYAHSGDSEEAEPFYREALRLQQEAEPGDDERTAVTLNNLALLLHDRRDYDEAEMLYTEALVLWKETLGEMHARIATGLNNLAQLLTERERYDKADSLHRQALHIQHTLFGSEHPDVAISLNSLGALAYRRGQVEEARQFFEEALAVEVKRSNSNHPNLATTYHNLAAAHQELQDYEEADSLYRTALAIDRKLFGQEHPDVGHTLARLARLAHERNRATEAEELFQEATALLRRVLPEGDVRLAEPLLWYGSMLMDQGRAAEALPLLKEAQDMGEDVAAENPQLAAKTRTAFEQCLGLLGKREQAEASLEPS